ncbi:flagellar basal-body MS-ring/collar protein FliF [Cysteiniphilum sp. QT6929]|uniref:flagellar basal-body MS-ring/collar protein FliF n=1 Tax=Cysteiniphilum sp. QT6929 TaxID=2975055 RepID=UPI0024B32BED|nr:flagellar basal-body MS-ring/collar protein FliF [Cysteiniphilum sp. QT6929]WHN66097.1 flagellar basal-body MS-ring/collar protein FliF [Cysteiniphilum sp. QT6929]
MLETLKQLILSNKKRAIGLISGLMAVVMLTILLLYWLMTPSYAILFSHLEPGAAASISQKLDALKISYKLEDDGQSILVDQSLVAATRLKLLSSGIGMSSHTGFELFDKNDLGMTDFSQKINYQRALQGELERTIMSLNAVKDARVHLVLPESSLFSDDHNKPKAAVNLTLKPFTELSSAEIQGIQRLVAYSVAKLDVNEVTVIDQTGKVLSALSDDSSANLSDQLKQQQAIENYLNSKANAILHSIFPQQDASARVSVELNFDQIKRTSQRYLQADQDPKQQQNSKNTNDFKGVISHIRETTNTSNTSNNANSNAQEVDYKVGNEVEQIIVSPGSIEHMALSIIVPKDTTVQQMDEIKALISNAVGINIKRGDDISIAALITEPKIATPKINTTKLPIIATQQPVKAVNAKLDLVSLWQQFSWHMKLLLCVLLFLALCGVISLITLTFRKRHKKSLSEHERQQLLTELNQWLTHKDSEHGT